VKPKKKNPFSVKKSENLEITEYKKSKLYRINGIFKNSIHGKEGYRLVIVLRIDSSAVSLESSL
jgi:hypothetical protein